MSILSDALWELNVLADGLLVFWSWAQKKNVPLKAEIVKLLYHLHSFPGVYIQD